MQSEPNTPMETLLRQYAEQRCRRLGPDPALPPHLRQRLQRELAEQFDAARPARPERGFWQRWRARILCSLAGSMAALALSLLVIDFDRKPQKETARNLARANPANGRPVSRSAPEKLKRLGLPAPPAAPSETLSVAETGRAAGIDRNRATERLSERAPLERALTAQNRQAALKAEQPAGNEAESLKPALRFSSESAQRYGLAARPASAPVKQQLAFRLIQDQNQAQALLPVLRSFEFQQTGQTVRLIDADGSVYSGILNPPPAQTALSARPLATTADVYFLRAAGTNRRLQQPIQIDARVYWQNSATNSSERKETGSKVAQKDAALEDAFKPPDGALQLRLLNRMDGRAQIGTNVIPFQAVLDQGK